MNNSVVFKGTPYIIKNKNFSTIDFEFIYYAKYDNNYLFYLNMLKQVLFNSNFYYKTEKEYKEEYKQSMIVNISMETNVYNEMLFIRFRLTTLDPKVVKNYDLERAFKFFIDSIYNPNIIDEQFNSIVFEREKSYLKSDILSSLKNIYTNSYQRFLNIVDDVGVLKNNIYNNMNLIESANPREMYKIYKNLILDNKPAILVYGNVDNTINYLIQKYVSFDSKKISFKKDYYKFLKPFKEKKVIIEDSTYNQSVLYVGYKVLDMSIEDTLYLYIIKNILGTGVEGLIFNKLRLEEGLVYSSNTWCNKNIGLLVIEAYINNNSMDKVLNCIDEVFSMLNDKEFLKNRIDRLKEDLFYSSIRSKDSKYKKLIDFLLKKMEYDYTISQILEKYETLNIDKLINFISRLKLDTVYFYRGNFDEKEKNI